MDSATPQFSAEQGLAENLGLKLGDELSYDIAGSKVAARITSLRRLEWDSMRVNFFVVGSPALLASQPASYITSFHLDAGKEAIVTEMIRAFPNLTVIDVGSLVRQLEAATDQAARAVEAVFGFALIAGIVVLVAVFNTTHDERIREMAILRALGARRQQLLVSLLTESVALGSLAGLLAGVGAGGLGFALARWVFHLPYTPGPALIGIAMVAGIVLAGISGYLGLRSVANVSPVRVLANGFV
jgi:putative ABC transport system permease protein